MDENLEIIYNKNKNLENNWLFSFRKYRPRRILRNLYQNQTFWSGNGLDVQPKGMRVPASQLWFISSNGDIIIIYAISSLHYIRCNGVIVDALCLIGCHCKSHSFWRRYYKILRDKCTTWISAHHILDCRLTAKRS